MKELLIERIREDYHVLPEPDAQQVAQAYGINASPARLAATKAECVAFGAEIGYPVVIKIFSRQIVHKSDVGGVVVGIKNDEEMARAYDGMMARVKANCPDAVLEGVVVQKMADKGVEVVIGALKNEQFGPVVMFGTGGVYVEVFGDVEFRLAPLTQAEAMAQIGETKIAKVLNGVRGSEPCDLDALSRMIVSVGRIISTCEEISEIDLNPVVCRPDGCTAVDMRIVLNEK